MTRPTPQGRRVDTTDLTVPEGSRPDPITAKQRRDAAHRMSSTAIGLDREDDLGSVLAHLGLLTDQEGLWT